MASKGKTDTRTCGKPATLTLVPCVGKFAHVTMGGQVLEVWKKNPRTGALGTVVPYDLGVKALQNVPPVVTLVPKVENGKFVSQLTDHDLAVVSAVQQGLPAESVPADDADAGDEE